MDILKNINCLVTPLSLAHTADVYHYSDFVNDGLLELLEISNDRVHILYQVNLVTFMFKIKYILVLIIQLNMPIEYSLCIYVNRTSL